MPRVRQTKMRPGATDDNSVPLGIAIVADSFVAIFDPSLGTRFWAEALQSAIGIGVVMLGAPVYWLWTRRSPSP